MADDKILEIENKIDKLRVVKYREEIIKSDSKFLSIVKGEYTLNNKKTIAREKVIKNTGVGNAVCIVAITKENKIILVIQPRVVLVTENKVNIEIPAGYIEENESVIDAGLRELREETGYVSSNLISLDSYYPSQGASSEKLDLVLALDCEKKESQCLDNDEFLEVIEVSFSEYEYLLENNYIMDVNSRIGYYKVLEYLIHSRLKDIVNTLIKRNETISTMESCTGGYLASCITNIENSSKVLRYSAVTYSNEFKIKMGVSKEVIDKYSVYSKECAEEMAYNISNFTDSSYGIGITGTLKRYDEENITSDNDKVYVCVYDSKNNKYYDYKYRVDSSVRINNKRVIVANIVNILREIIK